MIILDSSFLVAVEVETDQNHEEAVKIRDKIINNEFGRAVISDYIFDETVTVTFLKTKNIHNATTVGENLRNATEMINIEEEIFEGAWEIFKKQKDTKFSFTDCTILSLMEMHRIKNIATFDKDFKKIKEINIIQ